MRVLFPNNGFTYRKFSEVARPLGIPRDDTLSGADVPRLWQEKNYGAIKTHNLDDLRSESALYERMKRCRLT